MGREVICEEERQERENLWGPGILVADADGIHEERLRARHLSRKLLYVLGEIHQEMADEFMTSFLELDSTPGPITIVLNSPGGEVNSGLLIYDLIRGAENPVTIYVCGMAASMGAIILCAVEKRQRKILPHSQVMIHEPLRMGGATGSASTIRKISESINETKDMLVQILSEGTGKSIEEIEKAISYDNYMDPETACEFGLCGEIVRRVAYAS